MNTEDKVIQFSEKQLFKAFSSIEQRGKKPMDKDYYATVNSQLPSAYNLVTKSCELNAAIRKYRRRKSERISLAEIVRTSSNNIVLSVYISAETSSSSISNNNTLLSIDNSAEIVSSSYPPIVSSVGTTTNNLKHDEPPPKKKSRMSTEFKTTFSKS